MKISFITRFYKPFVKGGAEIYVGNITKKLVSRCHEIIVITPSPTNESYIEYINGVKVYRISPWNLYNSYDSQNKNSLIKIFYHLIDLINLDSYFKIKNILKEEKPDIVHIHNYKGLSPLSFKAVKDLDLPLIFTAHDFSPICVRTSLLKSDCKICEKPSILCKPYNFIQKFIIDDKPDFVTAPSNFVIQKLKSNGVFKHVQTAVLKNSVEIDLKKNEKSYKTIDLLYVGTIAKHKGVDILLSAFKSINNEQIRLHIVGKGPQENEIKKMAGSDKRIHFHGFLEFKDLIKLYALANITILPSICYDNSPMVIYESFCNSVPVIGSRVGGIPELIEDEFNGFLIEPRNINELKIIIERIIDNPTILKRLENNAFESAKKYGMSKHMDELESIYQGLL